MSAFKSLIGPIGTYHLFCKSQTVLVQMKVSYRNK